MRAVFFIIAMTSFISFGQDLIINGGTDILKSGQKNKIEITGTFASTTILESYSAYIKKTSYGYDVIPMPGKDQVAINVIYYDKGRRIDIGFYAFDVK